MISFEVRGLPAPQGSKRPVRLGNGKIGMVESSRNVGPWREAVRGETQRAILKPYQGPVQVTLRFAVPRPASAPARVRHPVKRPDLDKLVRSTLDGLTAGGAWADDSQVVRLITSKEFAAVSGCLIILEALS